MGQCAKTGAWLMLAAALGGCGLGSVLEGDRVERGQSFPASYKTELLAFFRNYLTDPVAVHDAAMAEPVQRTIGGKQLFLSCLKFNPRESDGGYRGIRVRGVVYRDGRLDKVVEELGDLCADATYAPFPELEAMSR